MLNEPIVTALYKKYIKEARIAPRLNVIDRYWCVASNKLLAVLLALTLASMIVHDAKAQTATDEEKISAVMNIITLLLLDDTSSNSIKLTLNETSNHNVSVSSGLDISFSQAIEPVEFCFVLSNIDDDLVFDINGASQPVVSGENCFVIPVESQEEVNQAIFSNSSGNGLTELSVIDVASANPSRTGLSSLTRSDWDERAVRKVLKIFAFGGHATQAQIIEWSNMQAYTAITQMLNFSKNNPRLSAMAEGEKYTDTFDQYGTFRSFINFISDESTNSGIEVDRRRFFGIGFFKFDESFLMMSTVRGLNPFRQRIGFWETNYHLATNREASVSDEQMVTYYDSIMEAHESNIPYYQVMGVAAKSAAAATQYGHRDNEWDDQEQICNCNDDFAREIHQLYYGIFGEGDPNHENVTIPETAKLLTGMPVPFTVTPTFTGFSTEVMFAQGIAEGTHHLGPVNVLGQSIAGSDAQVKIDALMPISMQHPESLENLPVMIISTLADDNLNEQRANQLRASWATMGVNRRLLDFLHNYAISDMFHSTEQFKYATTHERVIYLANKRNLDNTEAYTAGENSEGRRGRGIDGIIESDSAGNVFSPLNNVFGGQSSLAASDSAIAFENNYNDIVDRANFELSQTRCDTCDLGDPWEKKWATILPQREDGKYYVEDVAPWLWNHAVGNMDNYTELERAHLYALLGAANVDPDGFRDGEYFFDLNYLMCVIADYEVQESVSEPLVFDVLTRTGWFNYPYCREEDGLEAHELNALNATLTGDMIAADVALQSILTQLGNATLPLTQSIDTDRDKGLRQHALERIDNALDFIFTTPFIFAEGSQ